MSEERNFRGGKGGRDRFFRELWCWYSRVALVITIWDGKKNWKGARNIWRATMG